RAVVVHKLHALSDLTDVFERVELAQEVGDVLYLRIGERDAADQRRARRVREEAARVMLHDVFDGGRRVVVEKRSRVGRFDDGRHVEQLDPGNAGARYELRDRRLQRLAEAVVERQVGDALVGTDVEVLVEVRRVRLELEVARRAFSARRLRRRESLPA